MKMSYLGVDNPLIHRLENRFWGGERQHSGACPMMSGGSRFQFSQPLPKPVSGLTWQLQAISLENAALSYEAYLPRVDSPYLQKNQQAATPYTWREHICRISQLVEAQAAYRKFSYAILDIAKTKCLGFLQLQPIRPYLTRYGAPPSLMVRVGPNSGMVTYWLRQEAVQLDLTVPFLRAVHLWFMQAWEMDDHLFPVHAKAATAVAALEAVGLRAHFRMDISSMLPRQYAFYGV